MRSSVIPSLKYSCFGSSLMLTKGRTAIEGLSGNCRAGAGGVATCVGGEPSRYAYFHTPTAPAPTIRATAPATSHLGKTRDTADLLGRIRCAATSAGDRTRYTRTGSAMFLTAFSPRESKSSGSLFLIWS